MLPRLLTFTSLALCAAATAASGVFERDEAHFCKPETVTTTVYVTAEAPESTPSAPADHPPRPVSESYHPQSSIVAPPSTPTKPAVTLTFPPPNQPTVPVPATSAKPSVTLSIQPTISVPAPSPNPSSPGSPITPNPVHTGGKYANALYFTNWGIYGANFQPQQIPADQVTHILYAFADIGSDGEVKSSDSWADVQKHYDGDSWNDQGNNAYGCVKQLFIHKKNNRNLKVLLSIGGWTYSPKFAPVAATEAGRQRFASTAVKLVADWGFDGIDIDWEYPANAQQAQDYISLLQACRQALDAYAAQNAPGYHFLITVASPAGSQNYNNMDLKGMDPYVDSWHLMAYDYAGSWDTTSGHQANLFSNPNNMASTKFCTETAVDDYVAGGISADKIILGLPLYGRSFMKTTSLGQPYTGEGQGSIEQGIWLYKDLPRPGAQVDYDDVAKESYTYDPSTGELVSYDDIQSAKVKAQWLLQKGLGGAFFWEASGDKTGSQSLVGTMASQLGSLDGSQNLLSYPASQYANIMAGMP